MKPAAEVLLYTQKCIEAIKKIPAPKGIEVFVTTKASSRKDAKVVKQAGQLWTSVTNELLKKVDASAERASRKKTKGK